MNRGKLRNDRYAAVAVAVITDHLRLIHAAQFRSQFLGQRHRGFEWIQIDRLAENVWRFDGVGLNKCRYAAMRGRNVFHRLDVESSSHSGGYREHSAFRVLE